MKKLQTTARPFHAQNALRRVFCSLVICGVSSTAYASLTPTGDTSPSVGDAFWSVGGNDSIEVDVGWISAGALTIDGGSDLESDGAYLGSSGNGVVTVTDAGSSWSNVGDFSVGDNGNGTLNILAGASASSRKGYLAFGTDSVGAVNVDGVGSRWDISERLLVGLGLRGAAALSISNGGIVDVGGNTLVSLGYLSTGSISFNNGTLNTASLYADSLELSGTGTINANGVVGSGYSMLFDGAQSKTWNGVVTNDRGDQVAINLVADGSGDLGGNVTVQNGAEVASSQAYIGFEPGSVESSIVSGAGSSWTNTGTFYVGDSGEGSLTINQEGRVESSSMIIAEGGGTTGLVTVDGSGSELETTSFLDVGRDGQGKLVIQNGGQVATTGVLLGGQFGGSSEIVVESGGQLHSRSTDIANFSPNTNYVSVDGAGSIWTNEKDIKHGGDIIISNGGQVTTGSLKWANLDISSGGQLDVSGEYQVQSSDTFLNQFNVLNNGTINAGTIRGLEDGDFSGTGVINAHGLVGGDLSPLVFDNSNVAQTTLSGTNVVLNVTADGNGDLGSDMVVSGGAHVQSFQGKMGVETTSGNTVTVQGAGSIWEIENSLQVGPWGTSILRAEGGGKLISESATIISGSEVEIAGVGSRWENTEHIGGGGLLEVSSGGYVETESLGVDELSIDAATVRVNGTASWGSLELNGGTLHADNLNRVTDYSVSGNGTVQGSGVVGDRIYDETDLNMLSFSGSDTYTKQLDTGSGLVDFEIKGDGAGSIKNVEVSVTSGANVSFIDSWNNSIEVDGATSRLDLSGRMFKDNGQGITSELSIRNGATVDIAGKISGTSVEFVNGGSLLANDVVLNATLMSGAGSVTTHGLSGLGYADLVFSGSNAATFNINNGRGDDLDFQLIADGSGSLNYVGLDVSNNADVAFENVILYNYQGVVSAMSIGTGSSVLVNDTLHLDGGDVALEAGSILRVGTLRGDASEILGTGDIQAYGLVGRGYDTLRFNGSGASDISILNQTDDVVSLSVNTRDTADLGTSWEAFNGAVIRSRNGSLNADVNLANPGNTASLSGSGTKWEVSNNLDINNGELNIRNGAKVAVGGGMVIREDGTVNVDVTGNGVLVVDGALTNFGTLNLFSYATLAAGVYTPIEVGSFGGDGEVSVEFSAFGGIWDEEKLTFTVGDVRDTAGSVVDFDLNGERLGFNGQSVVTSFAGDAGNASFAAQDLSLNSIFGESVLESYQFTTDLTGTDVLLSFNVGGGYDLADLSIWHLADGETEWTLHDAENVSYTDGWASFSVSGFSGYAITAVPEPATYAALFGCFALTLVMLRRQGRS